MKLKFEIPKVVPIYDEKGNIKYYKDDEYVYIPNIKGELINIPK